MHLESVAHVNPKDHKENDDSRKEIFWSFLYKVRVSANANSKRGKEETDMANSDTIKLLKECDAGSKMAVTSIDDVMDYVSDSKLKGLLEESKKHHEKLGNEIHEALNNAHADEKEPAMMARGMSWLKTNMKLAMDESDSVIAELMTDGCDMGVKSLYQYLNDYDDAEHEAKALCKRLIGIEEALRKDLREFL